MSYRFSDRIIKAFQYTHSSKTDVASTFRRIRKQQADEEAKKKDAEQVLKLIRRKG